MIFQRNLSRLSCILTILLVSIVRRLDNAIHWINLFLVDNTTRFLITYPLDSDLSVGQRYPPFIQLGPDHLYTRISEPGGGKKCYKKLAKCPLVLYIKLRIGDLLRYYNFIFQVDFCFLSSKYIPQLHLCIVSIT